MDSSSSFISFNVGTYGGCSICNNAAVKEVFQPQYQMTQTMNTVSMEKTPLAIDNAEENEENEWDLDRDPNDAWMRCRFPQPPSVRNTEAV